ncbi:hypothetical protein DFP73DRAFT_566790 [Morchella snyderi]|nr:hypothetical protein DFP73DRAFT_566790 [Morchella snyderi]
MVFHQIQRAKFVQFFSSLFFFYYFSSSASRTGGQVPWCFVLFFFCVYNFFILGSGCLFFVYYFLLHVTGEILFLPMIFSLSASCRERVCV